MENENYPKHSMACPGDKHMCASAGVNKHFPVKQWHLVPKRGIPLFHASGSRRKTQN